MMNFGLFSEEATVIAAQSAVETSASQGIPILAKEEVPGGPLLIAAYLVMWVIVFVYLFWMHRSNQRLLAEVEFLEQRLDDRIADRDAAETTAGRRGV